MEEDIYLAFFESDDIAGQIIKRFEFFFLDKRAVYTHTGIVIKSSIIKDIIPCYSGSKYVILESTMSGKLNDGLTNTCQESYLGVQLRDFDRLLIKYKTDRKKLSVSSIKILPHDYKEIIKSFILRYINRNYDTNIVNLITMHSSIPNIKTNGVFCSDLICRLLQELNVIDKDIRPKKVSPNTLFTLVKNSISYPMYVSHSVSLE